MAEGITVEVPFTSETRSLTEDHQSNDLTPAQRRCGARSRSRRGLAFAKIVRHHREYREEGLRIRPSLASVLNGVEANYRLWMPSSSKSAYNSHQACERNPPVHSGLLQQLLQRSFVPLYQRAWSR